MAALTYTYTIIGCTRGGLTWLDHGSELHAEWLPCRGRHLGAARRFPREPAPQVTLILTLNP